jgi:hypothetical protein
MCLWLKVLAVAILCGCSTTLFGQPFTVLVELNERQRFLLKDLKASRDAYSFFVDFFGVDFFQMVMVSGMTNDRFDLRICGFTCGTKRTSPTRRLLVAARAP